MDRFIRGVLWILGFLLLVSAPLIILFLEGSSKGYGFLSDFNVSLAFTATAMLGVMFFLTARSRAVGNSFGVDIIFYFHRHMALSAYIFVLVHVAMALAVNHSFTANALNEGMPPGMRFGVAALVFLTALVISSVWRKQLDIAYEVWRLWHFLLAIAVVGFSLLHIFFIANYADSAAIRLFLWPMGILWIATVAWSHFIKPIIQMRRPYEVADVRPERGHAWTLTLKPIDHDGLRFKPGQFVWLSFGQAVFTLNEHPFSISSSACRHDRIEITIKELGDFTNTVKDIPRGQTAYIEGPHGIFSTDRCDAAQYFFFVGGIGITPVMSILRTMADRDDKRPLVLVYG